MSKLNEVFKRLQEQQKNQRELKKMYREALAVNGNYHQVVEELDVLKIKKKQIEAGVKADLKEEFDWKDWGFTDADLVPIHKPLPIYLKDWILKLNK